MSEQDSERRQYVRLPLKTDMMVRYGHRGQIYFGSCKDLSPGGLFVATKTPAPYGSEIILKFTLPGHEKALKAKGLVVRVHRDKRSRANNAQPGMHVNFTKFSDQTEDELKRFLVPRLRQLVIRQLAERRAASKIS